MTSQNDVVVQPYRLELFVHGVRDFQCIGYINPQKDCTPSQQSWPRRPIIAFRLADYPLVTLRPLRGQRGLAFQSGKSCLFRTSPVELVNLLSQRSLHVMFLDGDIAGPSSEEFNPLISWTEASGRLLGSVSIALSVNNQHQYHRCSACLHSRGGYTLTNATGLAVGTLDANISLAAEGTALIHPTTGTGTISAPGPFVQTHTHHSQNHFTRAAPLLGSRSSTGFGLRDVPEAADLQTLTQTLQLYAASEEHSRRQKAVLADTLHRLAKAMDLKLHTPRKHSKHRQGKLRNSSNNPSSIETKENPETEKIIPSQPLSPTTISKSPRNREEIEKVNQREEESAEEVCEKSNHNEDIEEARETPNIGIYDEDWEGEVEEWGSTHSWDGIDQLDPDQI